MILCLHGLGCSKRTFQPLWQVEALASYGILAFDFVGFGESPRDDGYAYDLAEQAQLCAQFIQQFSDRPVHLVGHSLGGTVATLIPEEILNTLASITLVEGRLFTASCRHSKYIRRFDESVFIDNHFPSWKAQVSKDPHLSFDLKQADPIAFYRSACSLYNWVDSNTLPSRLQKASSPRKWFIYGDQNATLAEIGAVSDMASVSIAQAGHFPMTDNPTDFYHQLAEVLQQGD